jgi:hypothetical protein
LDIESAIVPSRKDFSRIPGPCHKRRQLIV